MTEVATARSFDYVRNIFKEDRQKAQIIVTLLVLAVMITAFTALNSRFFTFTNFQNIARNAAPLIIVSCAMTAVMIARGLDLSVGSVIAMSSVLAASLAIAGVPLLLAFLIAVLCGVLAGAINGAVIVFFDVSPIIVTLGSLNIARGISYLITPGAIMVGLPDDWGVLGTSQFLGIPLPIVAALIVASFFGMLLHFTTFGKHVYAIGGNSQAARLSGINIERTLIVLYLLSGAMAAFAGIVLSSRIGSGDPNIGIGFELQVIAAVIIGGTSLSGGEGNIIGIVLGAIIITILSNGLNLAGVEPFWQYIAQGLVLISAVIIDRRVNIRISGK